MKKSYEEFRNFHGKIPKEVEFVLYGDFDPYGPAKFISNWEIFSAWQAAYKVYLESDNDEITR